MKETYKIEKLEDMPRFVPIIYINDTHFKDSTPRMVGNDIHDELVIDTGRNYLYYYNLQCGESSQECSDFRFVKREASCYDDEFYSHFCQMVDLEKLIADYTKQVRKEVLDQVYKVFTTESMWRELKDWWLQSGNCKELKDCLDAMIEETSIENIVKRFGHDSKLYQLLDQIQEQVTSK